MPTRIVSILIAAFLLAMGCFLGSTWYVSRVSGTIDSSAQAIARRAVPSIEHLAETRGQLRQLDVAATRFELSRGDAERAELVSARTAVDDEFERYLSLTDAFADERATWASMHRGLLMVDRAVSDLLAGAAAGTGVEVTRAVNTAADSIRTGIDVNAAHARSLAIQIEDGRRGALRLAWALDALSAIATVLAAYLVVRAIVHHHRVVEQRNRLVERRAEELEQFAARVAHDIVGPLSVTRLAIESVTPKVAEPVQRTLARGQRGVDRVVAIVDGLLRFARAGARPDPGSVTDVASVVRGVIDDLGDVARAADVTLELAPAPTCSVRAHAGVLASVVENLTRNAIKYMGDRPTRRVTVRLTCDGACVRFEVEDTGAGIAPAILEQIWEPHVRGAQHGQPGLGLGLATVARIVQAHGGRRGATSRVGAGSTFWCELPRANVEVVASARLRTSLTSK